MELIKNKIAFLTESNALSKTLAKKLIPTSYKLGNFRFFAKLHKEKFGIRPIISCREHPTSILCKLIELILQPIVRKTSTYIKDSQHFIQNTYNIKLESNDVFLYTCDFESLYRNINKTDAINLITDYIKDSLDIEHITPTGFNSILELIFTNNVFRYKNNFFIQKIGIAMGIICGPSIANLFIF